MEPQSREELITIIDQWIQKKPIKTEKKEDNFLCPKKDRCIMDCYHKEPHKYEEKYCNDMNGTCGIKCINELISDCVFFEEDFEI